MCKFGLCFVQMSKKDENTKQKILAVAQNLMQENGYNGITIEDVANKAKVSKGHVTYYFSTKKGLAIAVLEENAMQSDASYENLYASKSLDEFFVQCMAMAKLNKTTSCLLGTVSQESGSLDDELQKKCCKLFNDWEQKLISTFERILPQEKNHKNLATFFLAQLQGALLLAKAQRDPTILVANLQTLHEMMQHLNS